MYTVLGCLFLIILIIIAWKIVELTQLWQSIDKTSYEERLTIFEAIRERLKRE